MIVFKKMDVKENKVVKTIDVKPPEVKFEDGFRSINFFLQFSGFYDVFIEKSEKSRKFQMFQRYSIDLISTYLIFLE